MTKTNTRSLKKKSNILKLEKSHSLDKNIRHLSTSLESYELLSLFTIVCPVDSKLCECTPKIHSDGTAITYDLLASYCPITPKTVALSTAWYNKFDYFIDTQNNRQTLGRDMSWSLLHFKQHVYASLHTDVGLIVQQYSPIQQEGPLYFSILMRQLVLSNQ